MPRSSSDTAELPATIRSVLEETHNALSPKANDKPR
jgi:hypothetical protein